MSLERRTPLKPMSAKRRKLLPKRAAVRARVIERDGGCRARTVWPDHVCAGRIQVHEIVRRSQNADAWLDEDLCVALCERGHAEVHNNPERARQAGLLRHGWEAA